MDYIDITINPRNTAELHDTILQEQLPWSRFGLIFFAETDTEIYRPDPASMCDSLINYHLHIYDTIFDTVLYYTCESDLPVQYDDSLFYQEGQGHFQYTGSHGEDSIVTFILHIIPDSDTTIYDTITEDQLPWFAFDTVFTDSVADYIYHTFNEAGCDSTIHYYLHVYWNGDHCDTNLSFPNMVTPNGDGSNDRFVIVGLLENNCFKYSELSIYDRTGRCVYHKVNIADEGDWWDPAAQRIPAGTYFYYFKAHGINIHTQHTGVIEVLTEKKSKR
jgi:gliding motility-associated-like protein